MNTVSERTFGIELEIYGVSHRVIAEAFRTAGLACVVEGYNHTTRSHWKIVPDSSVNGNYSAEVVSPVLSGTAGLEQVRTACRVLRSLKAKVNSSCGLHVHHGAADLTLHQWKMLLSQYVKHEAVIDGFMPQSRRSGHNQYCKGLRSWIGSDVKDALAKIKAAPDLQQLSCIVTGQRRFHTVNLAAFTVHGTVEFRHHGGTTDAERVINWILFTQSLVEYTTILKFMTAEGADKAANLFAFTRFFNPAQKDAVKHLCRFYNDRARRLARAA